MPAAQMVVTPGSLAQGYPEHRGAISACLLASKCGSKSAWPWVAVLAPLTLPSHTERVPDWLTLHALSLRPGLLPSVEAVAGRLQVPAPSVFSEATKSLSIVVPAFNEEARLPATLDETLLCVASVRSSLFVYLCAQLTRIC